MKKLLSVVLVGCLLLSGISSTAYAKDKGVVEMPGSKHGISDKLQEKMEQLADNEKVKVEIWFKNIEESAEISAFSENEIIISMSEEEFLASKLKTTSGEEITDVSESTPANLSISEETKEKIKTKNEKMKKEKKERTNTRKAKIKTHNKAIKDSLNGEWEITFESQYAPMMYANLTKAQINELASNAQVESIFFLEPKEMIDNTSVALSTIGSTYIKNTWGYDGDTIYIGQIEPSVPNNGLSTIIENPSDSSTTPGWHANLVAGCIKSAAPSSTLYSTTATMTNMVVPAVEALMDVAYMDIINMSAGPDSDGYYTQNTRYIDYISTEYSLSFITTSGNNDTGSSEYVNEFGLAYNALTVGGYNDNSTTAQGDDSFHNLAYSYREDTGEKNVPEIMAPGVNISYGSNNSHGSSFAAPLVAGSFAQLGNIDYEAAYKPNLVKALAAVSAYYKLSSDSTWGNSNVEGNDAMSDRQGAGKFNAKISAEVLRAGRYSTFNNVDDSFSTTIPVNVTSSDLVLRVAAAWKQPVYTQSGSSAETIFDFDIALYDPSGNQVASSTGSNFNTELINYTVDSYGTYEIEITGYNTEGDTTDLAVAWY